MEDDQVIKGNSRNVIGKFIRKEMKIREEEKKKCLITQVFLKIAESNNSFEGHFDRQSFFFSDISGRVYLDVRMKK